jgi:hypothetical protein
MTWFPQPQFLLMSKLKSAGSEKTPFLEIAEPLSLTSGRDFTLGTRGRPIWQTLNSPIIGRDSGEEGQHPMYVPPASFVSSNAGKSIETNLSPTTNHEDSQSKQLHLELPSWDPEHLRPCRLSMVTSGTGSRFRDSGAELLSCHRCHTQGSFLSPADSAKSPIAIDASRQAADDSVRLLTMLPLDTAPSAAGVHHAKCATTLGPNHAQNLDRQTVCGPDWGIPYFLGAAVRCTVSIPYGYSCPRLESG